MKGASENMSSHPQLGLESISCVFVRVLWKVTGVNVDGNDLGKTCVLLHILHLLNIIF